MKYLNMLPLRLLSASAFLVIGSFNASAQANGLPEESGGMTSIALLIAVVVLGGGLLVWRRKRGTGNSVSTRFEDRHGSGKLNKSTFDQALDKYLDAATSKRPSEVEEPEPEPEIEPAPVASHDADMRMNAEIYRRKQLKFQFDQLPINAITELKEAKTYDLLPISDEPALYKAIEQTSEESDCDEATREEAVRVLASLKSRNAVDALSQVALYDLSANVRSRAVTVLAQLDHESVFEVILLAYADPTREVRAAAARSFFNLTFDRADAWRRIIATRDHYRMNHAAKAAIEAGLTERSFDRLLHDDLKIVAEAFALVSLMIKANEMDEIFKAIETAKDDRVKLALLHVIQVVHDERSIGRLHFIQRDESLSSEVAQKVAIALESFELAAV